MAYSQLINPSMAGYQCDTKLGSHDRQSPLAHPHVEEECSAKDMRGAKVYSGLWLVSIKICIAALKYLQFDDLCCWREV